MAPAAILEERHVGGRAPRRDGAAHEIIEIASDVRRADGAALDRAQYVADTGKGEFPAVDEDQAATGRLVIRLARLRRVTADEVEMRSASLVAPSRSEVASAANPSCRKAAAVSAARAAVRFQTRMRRKDGRAAQCARTSQRDSSPAPTTSIVSGSGLASSLAPSAESAAVRQ